MQWAGDQVKKYGQEAADKISHINAQEAEKEGETELQKLQKEVCFDCFIPNIEYRICDN